MRVRYTVHANHAEEPDGIDLEVRAPTGTRLGEVRAALVGAVAGVCGDADGSIWAGSRRLADDAILGHGDLRGGVRLGLGRPGPRRRETRGVLRLTVVTGPDAGLTAELPRRPVTVGRSPGCDMVLTDLEVSRRHVQITAGPGGLSVRDLGSTNGTRVISDAGAEERRLAPDRHDIPLGSYVALGDTIMTVESSTAPKAVVAAADGALAVSRPPRPARLPEATELAEPKAPTALRRPGVPWLAALLPGAAGIGLAWYLGSAQFLAFALLSPLIVVGTAVTDRLSGRRTRREEWAEYRSQRRAHIERVGESVVAATRARRRAFPDPAATALIAFGPNARIWERQRADPEFLRLRIGIGDDRAPLLLKRDGRDLDAPPLRAVPCVVDLRAGPVGVCGPPGVVEALARWLVVQVSVLHSPNDVDVLAMIRDSHQSVWTWLRWIPHATNRTMSSLVDEPVSTIAHDSAARARLAAQLVALVDERTDRRPSFDTEGNRWNGPWTVVIVDCAIDADNVPGWSRVLEHGAAVGVAAICVDGRLQQLPRECRAVLTVVGANATHVRRDDQPGSADVLMDRVTPDYADEVARALNPLIDPVADGTTGLPGEVRLVDLIGPSPTVTEAAIHEHWRASDGAPRAPLGLTVDGVVTVDLVRDGPHILVAGTTGSGKSELLQSLVVGLAAHCSPADLQFILIDYKGGAAFADCTRLPHAAGLVTDLDGDLTERALRCLRAELARRERMFARAGVADLASYRKTPAQSSDSLGRLVIVVDEFAALNEELPDFVTGLVGVAQRGRSLGVHLILATQRPGGAVSPEIRANTALRVALRVTDVSESSDIVGNPAASEIDPRTPGRAIVLIGGRRLTMQTASVSQPARAAHMPTEIVLLDRWGAPRATTGMPLLRPADDVRPERATDLVGLVATIRAAADSQPPVRRPWLDPLPDRISVDELDSPAEPGLIPFALADDPDRQTQATQYLDLNEGGGLLLVGGPRSGRTQTMRTIALTAARHVGRHGLHLHVIDCAGGELATLGGLPSVGTALTRAYPAEIQRFLQRLRDDLDTRRGRRPAIADPAEPIVVLIDGWEGLVTVTESLDAGRGAELLLQVLRECAGTGVTVVLGGDRGALSPRVTGSVRARLILPLADADDYALTGLRRRTRRIASQPPGRATTPSGVDWQIALARPVDPFDQPTSTGEWARAPADIIRVVPLPDRIPLGEVRGSPSSDGDAPGIVLGRGGDAAGPIILRTHPSSAPAGRRRAAMAAPPVRFLIGGPARSGRSTVLVTIAVQLDESGHTGAVVAGPRSPLSAWARDSGWPIVGPEDTERLGSPVLRESVTAVLIDDCEQFLGTAMESELTALTAATTSGIAVFAAGRTEDLVVTYRGLPGELRRHRCGLLLQPGPGDSELFGTRLPIGRRSYPAGRGYLIADHLVHAPGEPDRTPREPVALQVAQP
jgi:S-DNA-T family DNA segregation ATPase FtsK/SpoIIIE